MRGLLRALLPALLLAACAPTSQGDESRAALALTKGEKFNTLYVLAGPDEARQAVLTIKGANLRINDGRCKVAERDFVCSIGDMPANEQSLFYLTGLNLRFILDYTRPSGRKGTVTLDGN